MRILVTGSRWADGPDHEKVIREVLADVAIPFHATDMTPYTGIPGPGATLIHGKCPKGGADLIAHHAAADWDWIIDAHPADWDRYGKKAGMIRNAEMVATHQHSPIDICLAFPGASSVGTWDCIRKAAAAGIHTRIYPLKDCK